MIYDTKERYGSVSRFLHWGMALLVFWQMLKFFDRIDDGEHWVGQVLVPWHGSIGALLLVLIVLRIFWAVRTGAANRPPPPPAQALLVKAGHGLLYLALVLLPLTGVGILLGKGYGVKVFGMQLVAKGSTDVPWLADISGALHSPVAWLLLVMVLGHIGMALVHHYIKKDGVLRRML